MSISAKIVGSINLGGPLKLHADYKLEIVFHEHSWTLYRRYSAFEGLHESLVTTYGLEKVKSLGLVFPDKSYSGSFAGSFKYYVEKRRTQLQHYLNVLLSVDGTSDINAVQVFFDVENRGVSGVQIQLGTAKILKETLARTKLIKNNFGAYGTSFVVLLASGSIAVMASMYDNLSKAEIVLPLTNGAASITPIAHNNVILITQKSTNFRLYISFSTPTESAFWIRTISDFSVSTTVGEVSRKEQENKRKSEKIALENRNKNQERYDIKTAGCGNTPDELSAAFGI